uniref:ZP domain-containing protein n=2 Tax=Onchocerca TaxID=6281 RepID=A0A8R1TK79_ONCVO
MLTALFASIIISYIVTNVRATTSVFNNTIEDQPEIECGQGTIAVHVRTASQMPSYIFVKGHFHKDGCHFKQTNHATFRFEHCNVNRKREINPRGMAYSFTVIVQLHPLFITKVDRAYNVRCFYLEENKEVDAELQVSDLTTSMLESGHAMPQCSYTLHRDSPNGPVLRYGRVGDVVFHVWDCPSDVYAMLIHSCYILDGQGGEHQVINENGCSTDDFILPQLTYSNELTRSFAGASVVNLPDRESIYFSCQIKLCFKKGDYCANVTPPRCNEEIIVTRNSQDDAKHIEDELRNDQLLYTTTGPLATSNTVRIVHTAPPNIPVSPSFRKDSSEFQTSPTTSTSTDRVITTIKLINGSIAKSSQIFVNEIPTQYKFSRYHEEPDVNNAGFIHEIEGSGENENLLSLSATNDQSTTIADIILTDIRSSPKTSETTTITTTTIKTIATATSGIEIVRESNSTRDRRTVPENNYNIVDLDVATPQLKILDEGFDLPEPMAKPSLLNDRREEGICIPLLSMWILSGLSLVSISVAIATIIYSKVSSRKMALFYRY